MNIMDSVFKEIRGLITSVVIKYDNLARAEDTLEVTKDYSRYLTAYRKEDTFNTYRTYDIEAIIASGVTSDLELSEVYADNPSLIPDSFKIPVLHAQRRHIVDGYVEVNTYYRTLMGLPAYDEVQGVYAYSEFYSENGIEFKPVHELNVGEFISLDKSGEWERLKKEHPDKDYLKFIGTEKIDLITARESRNFQLLKMTKAQNNDILNEQFAIFYEQNREYMMSVMYSKDYSKRYDLYDNYMAMMLMVMVTQRLLVNTFKNGIDRDFYDPITLSLLFESYSVPYIENLPMDIQRLLAKNLNKLLHFKSTDKVIYDIAHILGFERARIFKYLLVKHHKYDESGVPIFKYKDIENDDGIIETVEDVEAMYEFYFQTVNVEDRNTTLNMESGGGRIPYDEVVDDDGFWWKDDPEVMKKLYSEEFNYIDTKYIHMNMMYRLTDMMLENTFFLRMILDKKVASRTINITLPRLTESSSVSYFDAILVLCSLVSRKSGLRGEILYSATKTLSIMGFDFNYGFVKFINNLPKKYRDLPHFKRIERSIIHMDMGTVKDINTLYTELLELDKILRDRLSETNDRDEYNILRDLYRSLYTTKNNENIFRKKDGTVAETYIEFLEDSNPEIHSVIELLESEEEIDAVLNHIIYRLEVEVESLRSLHVLNDEEGLLTEALVRLIRFFKSYTIDLTSFNILYVFDNRHFNRIKVMDKLTALTGEMEVRNNDSSNFMLLDTLYLSSRLSLTDKTKIKTKTDILLNIMYSLENRYLIKRELMKLGGETIIKDDVSFLDSLYSRGTNEVSHRINLSEVMDMVTVGRMFDRVRSDYSVRPKAEVSLFDNTVMDSDTVELDVEMTDSDSISIRHDINIGIKTENEDRLRTDHYATICSVSKATDSITVGDASILTDAIVDVESNLELKSVVESTARIRYELHKILTRDDILLRQLIEIDKSMDLYDDIGAKSKLTLVDENIRLKNILNQFSRISVDNKMSLKDGLRAESSTSTKDSMELVDVVNMSNDIRVLDSAKMKHSIHIDRSVD